MDEPRYYDENVRPTEAARQLLTDEQEAGYYGKPKPARTYDTELARLNRERDEARAELDQERKDRMRVSDALHEKVKELIAAHEQVRDRDELLAVVVMGVLPSTYMTPADTRWTLEWIGSSDAVDDVLTPLCEHSEGWTDPLAALSAARDALRDKGLLGEVTK